MSLRSTGNTRRQDQPVSEVNMFHFKSQEQIIQDFIKIHGDAYDYSLVKYTGSREKVIIICKIHGIFEQKPVVHLQGSGCKICGQTRNINSIKKTTKWFIEKSKNIHGDTYLYDLVDYKRANIKVDLICKIHGVFAQTPSLHLKGSGCPKCGIKKNAEARRTDLSNFEKKARAIHGNKYDYSLVDYVNNQTKVKIICPVHGIFDQFANNHLAGKGCHQCKGTKKKTTIEFIDQARKVHGDKFDYSLVDYVNALTKINIICPIHGTFSQIPNNHLWFGCEACGGNKRKTTNKFIEEARLVHGDTYDYSLSEYVDAFAKVKIICRDHGIFEQSPDNHLHGRGCSSCSNYGFNPSKPAILYFLKFNKSIASFWKIGVTNNTVRIRYGTEANHVTDSHEWRFDNGKDALILEQKVLAEFIKYKFNLPLFPILNHGGESECFAPSIPKKKVIRFIESEIKLMSATK